MNKVNAQHKEHYFQKKFWSKVRQKKASAKPRGERQLCHPDHRSLYPLENWKAETFPSILQVSSTFLWKDIPPLKINVLPSVFSVCQCLDKRDETLRSQIECHWNAKQLWSDFGWQTIALRRWISSEANELMNPFMNSTNYRKTLIKYLENSLLEFCL